MSKLKLGAVICGALACAQTACSSMASEAMADGSLGAGGSTSSSRFIPPLRAESVGGSAGGSGLVSFSFSPADGDNPVPPGAKINITFGQPMNEAVSQQGFSSGNLPPGALSWSADARVLTYTPSIPLNCRSSNNIPQACVYGLSGAFETAAGAFFRVDQSVKFYTAKRTAYTASPIAFYTVASDGSSLQCVGDCDGASVGDTYQNVGERAVFVYDSTVQPGNFFEDAVLDLSVYFANGNVGNLFPLDVARNSAMQYPVGTLLGQLAVSNGVHTSTQTTQLDVSSVITNGNFGSNTLYLSVYFASPTNSNQTWDEVFLSDGRLETHYLTP